MHLRTCRMDTHRAVLEAAKRKLAEKVKTLGPDALQTLLASSFPYIGSAPPPPSLPPPRLCREGRLGTWSCMVDFRITRTGCEEAGGRRVEPLKNYVTG